MNRLNQDQDAAIWTGSPDTFAAALLRQDIPYAARQVEGTPPPRLYEDIAPAETGYYVELQRSGVRPFYCWFVPGKTAGLPLLVYSPGYEATLRNPPDLTDEYHVLFLSPLGYGTPQGQNNALRKKGSWPVLPDTVLKGETGYDQWLLDGITAIRWAKTQAADSSRLIFAGCSQGGGISLVLGSVLREQTMAVCADQPYLVDFSGSRIHDVISFVCTNPSIIVRLSDAERRLRCIDPMCHAPRLTMPVLVCSGELDRQCPAEYNEQLFRLLPGKKDYICFPGRGHGYHLSFHNAMLDFLRKL